MGNRRTQLNGVVRAIRMKRKGLDMAGNTVVRRLDALEGETVEIRWALREGGFFHQRVTIPPKATREVREKLQEVCLTCGHLHYYESGDNNVAWGRCKTCPCEAASYMV